MKKINVLLGLLFITFLIGGCGTVKHQTLVSIQTPYQLTIDEFLTNFGKNGDSLRERAKSYNESWKELGLDIEEIGNMKGYDDVLKSRVIAIPVVVQGLSVISRNTLYLRECSFKGDYLHNTEKTYSAFMNNISPKEEYKGTILLNPDHLRRLKWVDAVNRLQKDICLNTVYEMDSDLEQYTQNHKIDSETLKKALDEIDALEGSK